MAQMSGRRRLTEAETQRRMFAVSAARIRREGLSATFDQLRFEEIIGEADVSRSTVYRRWPSREAFYGDLLRVLLLDAETFAFHSLPPGAIDGTPGLEGATPDDLATPGGRRALLVELIRARTEEVVRVMARTPAMRTYSSLRAIVRSAEPALAAEGLAILAQGHESYLRRVTAQWRGVLREVGYRPGPGVSLLQLATLAAVVIRGYLEVEGALPEAAVRPERCDPFGTGREADWTILSRGYATLLLGLLEPDPGYRPAAASVAHAER